jgi:hypothetical protein
MKKLLLRGIARGIASKTISFQHLTGVLIEDRKAEWARGRPGLISMRNSSGNAGGEFIRRITAGALPQCFVILTGPLF